MRAPYPVVDIQSASAPKTPPESRSGAVAGSIVTLSFSTGAVAERLNAPDSKSGSASGSTGVRIPPAPLTSKVYETASLIRRRFARFGASYAFRRVSEISRSDQINQHLPKSHRVSLVAMFGMSPREVSVPCSRAINRDSQQNQGAKHHSSPR